MKWYFKAAAILTLIVVAGVFTLWFRYREYGVFPDLTQEPKYPDSVLEVVSQTDYPPGNIAVSGSGRLFFTFHPISAPPANVLEWVNNKAVPFPNADWQSGGAEALAFQEVLSMRIDQENHLWVLDNGVHGQGTARILAFDIDTRALVHHHDFSREIFGFGSHANDFQIRPQGDYIFISDASLIAKRPALVIYDIANQQARRVLEGDESVSPGPYQAVVRGRKMTLFGLFTINPGVDGIALNQTGDELYFAAISADYLYKISVGNLLNSKLSPQELREKVEIVGAKTMTDGMTTDVSGNIYLSDPEYSAILTMNPQGKLTTLVKSQKIRWPDGFSFGPDGYLYFTCSALNYVIGFTQQEWQEHAPFQIFRFKPEYAGRIGH